MRIAQLARDWLGLKGKTENRRICVVSFERRSGLAGKLWDSWPFPALSHVQVEVGGTSNRQDVRGAKLVRRC